MIPLSKYVAWFIRQYVWPVDVQTHKDMIGYLCNRLNLVDMAMIYEAICTKQYGIGDTQARIYAHSMRYDIPAIHELMRSRVNGNITLHPLAKFGIEHALENMDRYEIRIWISKSLKAGNTAVALTCIHEGTFRHNDMLWELAPKYDSVEVVLALLNCNDPRPDIRYTRPRTLPILRQHGLTFKSDPYGVMLCIVANVDPGGDAHNKHTLEEYCTAAFERGKCLDWIGSQMSNQALEDFDQMSYYHPRTIQWLMSRGISVMSLCMDVLGYQNILTLLPYTNPVSRACLLARSRDARLIHKTTPWDYNKEAFRQAADIQAEMEMQKYES